MTSPKLGINRIFFQNTHRIAALMCTAYSVCDYGICTVAGFVMKYCMQKNLNQEKQTAKHTPTTVVQYCTVTTHQSKIEESTVSKKNREQREKKKNTQSSLYSTVQYHNAKNHTSSLKHKQLKTKSGSKSKP
jgi:hypothetical protein